MGAGPFLHNTSAVAEVFLLTGNPEGSVSAEGGAVALRDSGIDSELYIKRSAADNNTNWDSLVGNPAAASIFRSTASGGASNTIPDTPTKFDDWTTNGPDFGNISSDQANDEISIDRVIDTVNGDLYEVTAMIAFEMDDQTEITFEIYFDDGVSNTLTQIKSRQWVEKSDEFHTSVLTGQFRGPTSITGNGAISLYYFGIVDDKTITFYESRLTVKRIK